MDSSRSKVEIFKPVLLKAGIPLAFSVAGFIYARIIAQRNTNCSEESLSENDKVSSLESNKSQDLRDGDSCFHSLRCACTLSMEESQEINDFKFLMEKEISRLSHRLEDLERRESELEMEFIGYCEMKEKESTLMELSNILLLEMVRVEFMDRELSFMEAESEILEDLVGEYMKVLEEIEDWKSENELLQRQVKLLVTQASAQSRIIGEHDLELEAREEEFTRIQDELETRTEVTKRLQNEIGELRIALKNLELNSNKIKEERTELEDYTHLSQKLEQLRKDHAAEHKELIYLRWSNACLRHELMKNIAHKENGSEQKNSHLETDSEESIDIGNYGLDHELDASMALEHNANEPRTANVSTDQACSKRRVLFKRLKRLVQGGDQKGRARLEEKERHGQEVVKCFGRHSVSKYQRNISKDVLL